MTTCEFDESNANWSGGAGREGEYVERSSTRKISRHNEESKSISGGSKKHGKGAIGAAWVLLGKPFLNKIINSEVHISDDLLTRTKCQTF